MLPAIYRKSAIALLTLLLSPTLYGWNFAGHKIASQITWDVLDQGARNNVVAILKGHPRYGHDFEQEMPSWAREGTDDERGRWLLQQAAVWPDIVRDTGQPTRREQYNRPKWHYVDRPLFLSDEDQAALQGNLPGVHADPALAADLNDMNIFQALEHNLAILRHPKATTAERAVALCWVAHLTQDIHQPNHTMSLVVPKILPRGDRTGTTIPIKGQGRLRSLHALWDGMVSEADSPTITRRIARSLADEYRDFGRESTRIMDMEDWAAESRESALSYVYTPELLDQILSEKNRLLSVEVSPHYRSRARTLANARVAQAGYRLARTLSALQTEVGVDQTDRARSEH